MTKHIWTYPVINTNDFSQLSNCFGGCMDKACWCKDKLGEYKTVCEFYKVDPISKLEQCTKGEKDGF